MADAVAAAEREAAGRLQFLDARQPKTTHTGAASVPASEVLLSSLRRRRDGLDLAASQRLRQVGAAELQLGGRDLLPQPRARAAASGSTIPPRRLTLLYVDDLLDQWLRAD